MTLSPTAAVAGLHHSRHGPDDGLLGRVLGELAGQILRGEHAPGQVLANESELVVSLGVSRTTIREAIKILSSKGLVETRQRVGTRVLPRREWNLLDGDVLAWMMDVVEPYEFMRELLEIRRIIEPDAAALAAERASDTDIATLMRSCVDMDRKGIGVERFVEVDAGFHEAVLMAARNPFLAAMAKSIRASLYAFIRLTTEDPSAFDKGSAVHRKVVDRIVARDSDGARKAMQALLESAEKHLDRISRAERAQRP